MSITDYLKKWDLSNPQQLAITRTSHLFLVSYKQDRAVLKILTELGQRDEAEGALALRCYDGKGAVSLILEDSGAHLLSYADGKSLNETNDFDATEIICQILRQLHAAKPVAGLKSLSENFQSLFRIARSGNPDQIFLKGAETARQLLNSEANKVVLHGDIHHKNIIQSSRYGWQSIDPKGLLGERTYDFANIFYNPEDKFELVENAERINVLAKTFSKFFSIEKDRILKFAFAYGCLSASWAIEDEISPNRRIRIANIIQSLL